MLQFSKKISRLFKQDGNSIIDKTKIKIVPVASNSKPVKLPDAPIVDDVLTSPSPRLKNKAVFASKDEARQFMAHYAKTLDAIHYSSKDKLELKAKFKAANEMVNDRPSSALKDLPIAVPKYSVQTAKDTVYYIAAERYYIGYVDGRAIVMGTSGTYNIIKYMGIDGKLGDAFADNDIGLYKNPIQIDATEFANLVNARLTWKELQSTYRLYQPTDWDRYTIEPLDWQDAVKVF